MFKNESIFVNHNLSFTDSIGDTYQCNYFDAHSLRIRLITKENCKITKLFGSQIPFLDISIPITNGKINWEYISSLSHLYNLDFVSKEDIIFMNRIIKLKVFL